MKKLGILALLVICACGHIKINKSLLTKQENLSAHIEIEVGNGEARFVQLKPPTKKIKKILCEQNEIIWAIKNESLIFYVPVGYYTKKKNFKCVATFTDRTKLELVKVNVKQIAYKKGYLKVPYKKLFPPKEALARIYKEKIIKKNAYKNPIKYPLFEDVFSIPLESKITSYYGTRRLYNNKVEKSHFGNDFRAAIGVPIISVNTGKVVLARDLYYSGNTVIIDHGLGVFTIYMHLSKIDVQEGDIIPKGDRLGLAGMTGRVTGPHLHWGVKVNNNLINGFSIIEQGE